jgi:acyl-CoA hydrolase
MTSRKKEMTCNQTRNVRTAFVGYNDLNDKDTLFGGEIMSHFDSASGRAVFNFVKRPSFTATVDLVAFIHPVLKNEAIYVEAYVSGCGKTSVETFAKLIATDVRTGESRICAYSFLTFVITDSSDPDFVMPLIIPESEEEKLICSGYEERRINNLVKRNQNSRLLSGLSTKQIWDA